MLAFRIFIMQEVLSNIIAITFMDTLKIWIIWHFVTIMHKSAYKGIGSVVTAKDIGKRNTY